MRWLPARGGRWPARLDRGTRRELGIPSAERVLGWGIALSSAGQRYPVVASDRALYGSPLGPRVQWDEISKATWEDPVLAVTVARDGKSRTEQLEVIEPGLLPEAVRTQVTDSVVITERLDLGGGLGAQAVARRSSQDGEVRWIVTFDPGADPQDPGLRAQADRALAELRATLGI